MTCKLRRVKRFLRGKIQPESLPMSEMVLAFGSSPEKAGQTRRKLLIEDFAVYKQPTTYIANDNCLFRQRPRKHTSSDPVGKNLQNGFKHDMFWQPNN